MRLLRLVSWPYVRQHRWRTVLTLAGIVLGVAVFVGMHTANESVRYAFNKTVDQIAGAAQLQVSAGEGGFEEEVLERVQGVPGVRVAVPVIESTVNSGIAGQGNLLILGVDLTGDRSLRDYDFDAGEEAVIDDPLVFLAQADSLLVSREFASRNGLAVNSKLKLDTMEGTKTFTVRGVMKSGGLSQAFGGNLAIMDIYAAQKMFGRGRRFDRVDLAVNEGASVDEVRARIERVLGTIYSVEPPAQRSRQFESLTRVYGATANLTSMFALFIGMFIIYNTFAIAVTQRRREIGILRALGAERRQIRNLFLVESGITGLVGSLLGIGFGLLIAQAMSAQLGNLLGEVYGIAQRAQEVATDARVLGGSLLIGLATSLVAGWIPAQAAGRVDPVQALQKGKYQMLSAGENRRRRILALVLTAVSAACLVYQQSRPVFYVGYLLIAVAAVLLAPALSLWLAKWLRPLWRVLRPVEGTLAADSLIQAPRRTSGTVAALMLSLAMVVSIGGLAKASYESIHEWLLVALNPDLFVSPTENFAQRNYRFPAEVADAIAQAPGVAEVQRVRMLRIPFRGALVLLFSAETDSLARHVNMAPVEGDASTMYARAARGEACLISENFLHLYQVHVGDVIDIPTPQGVKRLPVAGAVVDYSDQQGSILIDRSLMTKWWNDTSVNVIRVYAKPEVKPRDLRESLTRQFGHISRLVVLTNGEVRDFILRITDQWFAITYVQIAVAVLVAMLGIVNTLIVSITDRRRELGVLQAVGGLRRQVRYTIWLEALAIGAIGLILGLVLGAINLRYALELGRMDLGGFRLDYLYPWTIAAALIPAMLMVAWISALGPAEQAVRSSLVESLEYE